MKTNAIPKDAAVSLTIYDSYSKAKSVLEKHEKAVCSVSGGKDSDVMLDIIWRLDAERKVQYVWFNTGIEYEATKRHLDYLENKYGVEIIRAKPFKSVPYCTKTYGQPVISKLVSDMIATAQRHGFKWENRPMEQLTREYKRFNSVLRWWTNYYPKTPEGKWGQWCIGRNVGLKEFLMINPPDFKVSSKCCYYAKKKTAHIYEKDAELKITGIRKAEGGVRSIVYKNCYSNDKGIDAYRPLFWYTEADLKEYCDAFEVRHSDCYEVYGLKRTGCVGCPYNRRLHEEMKAIETYEPNLYKVCNHVFKEAYDYTKKFREFKQKYFPRGKCLLPEVDICAACKEE